MTCRGSRRVLRRVVDHLGLDAVARELELAPAEIAVLTAYQSVPPELVHRGAVALSWARVDGRLVRVDGRWRRQGPPWVRAVRTPLPIPCALEFARAIAAAEADGEHHLAGQLGEWIRGRVDR